MQWILTSYKSQKLLPACAADCMVGISPPGGRIPLRLRPGPSMGLEPLIKVWGLLHQENGIVRTNNGDQQVTGRHQSWLILLPDGANHIDEIEPCRVGHDLRRCGSRSDGCTHGWQGDCHDRQGLAQGQLLLGKGREEGRLRLALNHGRVRRGGGHR